MRAARGCCANVRAHAPARTAYARSHPPADGPRRAGRPPAGRLARWNAVVYNPFSFLQVNRRAE
eukprot:10909558-Lingulodinium_polyedra.AAC.1